jgi:hypothetical protein
VHERASSDAVPWGVKRPGRDSSDTEPSGVAPSGAERRQNDVVKPATAPPFVGTTYAVDAGVPDDFVASK